MFCNANEPKTAWAAGGEAVSKGLKRLVADALARGKVTPGRVTAADFSGHSLRRGGAQFMRDEGIPRDLIKLHGRWRSDAVDVYFSTMADGTRRAIAQALEGTKSAAAKWRATCSSTARREM